MTIRDLAFFFIGASVGTVAMCFRALAIEIIDFRRDCRGFVRRLRPSPDGRRMAETENTGSGRKPDQQVPGSKLPSSSQSLSNGDE